MSQPLVRITLVTAEPNREIATAIIKCDAATAGRLIGRHLDGYRGWIE